MGQWKVHSGVFGASTYIVLKVEYEWREAKGRVNSAGRWKWNGVGSGQLTHCEHTRERYIARQ